MYIRGLYIEDQAVFWTAEARAATASLAKDDGSSASGEWLLLWLCCCVDGLESAICRSIHVSSVHMTTKLREISANPTQLTQFSDPELEHLVLTCQHLRLSLVECGIIACASKEEIFSQRA